MTSADAILWQSARNLLDAQGNLYKLCEAFWQIECSDNSLHIEDFDQDASNEDFFQPVWNYFFRHRRNGRANAKTLGVVTIALQLTADEGAEANWIYGKRSKILVGYAAVNNTNESWNFHTAAPNEAGYCQDCVAEGFFWRDESSNSLDWFYAVPLDLLTSTQCVRKLVVEPLHDILRAIPNGNAYEIVANSLANIKDYLCQPPQLDDG